MLTGLVGADVAVGQRRPCRASLVGLRAQAVGVGADGGAVGRQRRPSRCGRRC